VIIPVHRGERFLEQTLASVAAQTDPVLETIVVVDGTDDGSAEIAAAAGARVVHQDHAGVAAARNAGAALAAGSVLAFLDQDDVWRPPKLELQLARLSASPRVDIVLCHLHALLTEGTPRPPWLPAGWQTSSQPAYLPSAWLIRAELMDSIGPFDETLQTACDADWLARAKDLGQHPAMLPDALLQWRIHGENASYDRPTMARERLAVLRRSIARQRRAAQRG
jgi:glycosyltransferase involved in cell wall biosynthesis